MACKRWRRVIFLWTDRERESLPFAPVERHLGGCPECRRRVEQIERLALAIRRSCCTQPVPDGLVERIRVSIETQVTTRRSRA